MQLDFRKYSNFQAHCLGKIAVVRYHIPDW